MSKQVKQTKLFAKQKKRLHPNQIRELDQAVKHIMENPKIGVQKKGDLQSVWVYKFKMVKEECLLAYQFQKGTLLLLALDSHENFYRDLKRFLR